MAMNLGARGEDAGAISSALSEHAHFVIARCLDAVPLRCGRVDRLFDFVVVFRFKQPVCVLF